MKTLRLLMGLVAMFAMTFMGTVSVQAEGAYLSPGYYYILPVKSNVGNALCYDGSAEEAWRILHYSFSIPERPTLDDARYIFKIDTYKGGYSLMNHANKEYMGDNGTNGRGEGLGWVKNPVEFTLTYYEDVDAWTICNNVNAKLDAHGHGICVQTGNVCGYWGEKNDANLFAFVSIPDEVVENIASWDEIASSMEEAIKKAKVAIQNAYAYNIRKDNPLITNATDGSAENQFWGTQEPGAVTDGYSRYAHLIDGTTSTCFQSTWSTSVATPPQPFQVDLRDHPVKNFAFEFGLRDGDWGYRELWTDVTLYATNDATVAAQDAKSFNASTWDKIAHLTDFPTDWISGDNNRYFTYRVVDMAQKEYRFYRFMVNQTLVPQSNMMYTIGEFQMYEIAPEEGKSAYIAVPGMKELVDRLTILVEQGEAGLADGSATKAQVKELNNLAQEVADKTPNTERISGLILEVKDFVSSIKVGEDWGDVTQEQMDKIQQAIVEAEGFEFSLESIQSHVENLEAAFKEFKKNQITFDTEKWYYIVNADQERIGCFEQGGESADIEQSWTEGSYLYTPTHNSCEAHWDGNKDALKWGLFDYLYNREEKYVANNPYAMWKMRKDDDGNYIIFNRATGKYMGDITNGKGRGGLTLDPTPYQIKFLSENQLQFVCKTGTNTAPLHAKGDGWIYAMDGGVNSASSWYIKPVDDEAIGAIYMPVPNNSIQIMTLPYAVESEDLADVNEENGIKTYSVKRINAKGGLELTQKYSFEAGEPFIIVAGDYTAEEGEMVNFAILPPNEFTTEAKTANGLVGVLDYTVVGMDGMGYFVDSKMQPTTITTVLQGMSGYLNPALTKYTTESNDLCVDIANIIPTAVKEIENSQNGRIDVYSADGKLLKHNVTSKEARATLPKGIYIIGHQKVCVTK